MFRSGLVLATIAVTACCCERTPAEPSSRVSQPHARELPQASAHQAEVQASPDATPSRCMVPLSQEAPASPPPAASCPPDPVFGGVRLPKSVATFQHGSDGSSIEVELATSPEMQERGLMFRTRMPENEGMLFAFGRPSVHTFWMRNTCIPLDMMFITEDGFIAGIVESAPTLNDAGRSIPCPVSYVLEVNAGFARRHGVKPGQMVKLPPQGS